MARRKTNKEFVKEVRDLVGDEYVFLEEYVNSKTKIKCRHNVCGQEWDILPNAFLRGNGCPKCGRKSQIEKQTKTDEGFTKEIYDLVGDEYTFLESYINARTKIKCKHNECGHKWEITPNNFIRGKRCPECAKEKFGTSQRLTYKEVKYYIEVESYSGCKLLSKEYKNNSIKMLFKCKCGNEFKTSFAKFKDRNKRQCNKCGKENQILLQSQSHDDFIRELTSIHGDEYSIIDEYKSRTYKVLAKHNKCGYEWKVLPGNLVGNKSKSPTGCPRCNRSKGEIIIERWLNQNGIINIAEYSFDECMHIEPLRFDFYLPDYNLLIEYDGEGHYQPFRFSKDKNKMIRKLKLTQLRDNIKNQYCKDNNIPLLRIPYWEFDNIEQILEEWLEKYGVLHKNKANNLETA